MRHERESRSRVSPTFVVSRDRVAPVDTRRSTPSTVRGAGWGTSGKASSHAKGIRFLRRKARRCGSRVERQDPDHYPAGRRCARVVSRASARGWRRQLPKPDQRCTARLHRWPKAAPGACAASRGPRGTQAGAGAAVAGRGASAIRPAERIVHRAGTPDGPDRLP